MAQLSVTVPDASVAKITAAFSAVYNYDATIPDPQNPGQMIPNPMSASEFVRHRLKCYLVETVAAHGRMQAEDSIRTELG